MSPISDFPKYDFSILRTLRKREGMTIGQVSERSGVSTAVISKLERNQSSAELETLFKLARVFGMTATDLIAMAESPLAHVTRENAYASDGFELRRIRYSNASVFFGSARKGAKISKPEIHHDEYEICWVIEGSIRLVLPHENHALIAGESLQFDAIQQHTYEALEDAKLIITHVRKENRF
ncbi:MAG: helix-turn-helix domain-containing protein [Puniceicoccaceae bacterium]